MTPEFLTKKNKDITGILNTPHRESIVTQADVTTASFSKGSQCLTF